MITLGIGLSKLRCWSKRTPKRRHNTAPVRLESDLTNSVLISRCDGTMTSIQHGFVQTKIKTDTNLICVSHFCSVAVCNVVPVRQPFWPRSWAWGHFWWRQSVSETAILSLGPIESAVGILKDKKLNQCCSETAVTLYEGWLAQRKAQLNTKGHNWAFNWRQSSSSLQCFQQRKTYQRFRDELGWNCLESK